MSAGIYRISNVITKNVYIGYTSNLKNRFLNYQRKQVKSQPLIYNSLCEFGVANHEFEILHDFGDDTPTTRKLKEYESKFIVKHKNDGYTLLNSNNGGAGCSLWSSEKKREKSVDRKGFCKRNILQYDLKGNFICEWESISLASKQLGIDYNHLIRCCKGASQKYVSVAITGGGFQWRYKIENDFPIKIDSSINAEPIPVIQYSLNGDLIKFWEDVRDVKDYFNLANISGINYCCKKVTKSICGYQWRYYDDNYEKKLSPIKIILQYDMKGNFIAEWNSSFEAGKKLNIDNEKIGNALAKLKRGRKNGEKSRTSAGGFQWIYKTNDTIPLKIEPYVRY